MQLPGSKLQLAPEVASCDRDLRDLAACKRAPPVQGTDLCLFLVLRKGHSVPCISHSAVLQLQPKGNSKPWTSMMCQSPLKWI